MENNSWQAVWNKLYIKIFKITYVIWVRLAYLQIFASDHHLF